MKTSSRLPKGSLKNAVKQILKTPPTGNIAEIARKALPKIIELGIKATEASLYQCIRNWASSATTDPTIVDQDSSGKEIVPVMFSNDDEDNTPKKSATNRSCPKPMSQLNNAYDRIEESFCNLESGVREFLKIAGEVVEKNATEKLEPDR